MTMVLEETTVWTEICPVDLIDVETGVAALVGGEAVAVFRTYAGEVLALSNYDPVSHASVLSRGIVGTRTVDGEVVDFVASPIYKEAFDLRTGVCLDKPEVSVPVYRVDVREGVVYVAPATESVEPAKADIKE